MTEGWSAAREVLCVRLDQLGDVLMTGPAMRALKESAAARRITLLTSPSGAEAGRLLPEVDEVLVYEAPWMKASLPRERSAKETALIRSLRARRFDAAAIFTVYSQSPLPASLLCYLAEIPLRLAHCRENPYHLLTHWVKETEPELGVRHEVQRQLDLAASVGAETAERRLSVSVPEECVHSIDGLLSDLTIGDGPWVVVHPGATAESRRYPAEGFAALCRSLARESGWRIVLTGTEPERELIGWIQSSIGAPCHSLAGELSLGEFAALLSRAPLLISNNTGAVHLAAAVGTPVVDLYALTNPQHHPWMVPQRVLFHDVPCKFCHKSLCPEGHHHCLRLVTPEQVVRAARELMGETAGTAATKELPLVYPGH
ncbi:glycosyltransferase family 9 protein [Nitrospira moscoviensis]|uniref:Lipopolysaccharide heptosyltransferase n=1 Tax=Nitrospira moscoviensis TaxID=42253 RepID=A0A0K2GD14_NITMO|nr:glycosyltransferase family 9 protein [Nitrospira moscoviensis]ALA58759.1 Lipopolysaccharide heptosyltransferase [Nitrospira moscoviensis]